MMTPNYKRLREPHDREFLRIVYRRLGDAAFWSMVADAVDGSEDTHWSIHELSTELWLEWVDLEAWSANRRPNLGWIAEMLVAQHRDSRRADSAAQ